MIIPRFKVDQDDNSILINMKITMQIKTQNIELHIEDKSFIFSWSPYYLRLNFPGSIVDDEEQKAQATYDIKTSLFKVVIPKKVPGEHFPDLDLLTTLLVNPEKTVQDAIENEKKDRKKTSLISELDEKEICMSNDQQEDGQEIEEFKSWNEIFPLQDQKDSTFNNNYDHLKLEIDHDIIKEDDNNNINLTTNCKYGFNNQYTGCVQLLPESGNDINEIEDPEHTTYKERSKIRKLNEYEKFDPEYYVADTFDNNEIKDMINISTKNVLSNFNSIISSTEDKFEKFSEKEKAAMASLPRKTYLIDNLKATYLCILPLLFGFAYEKRINYDPGKDSRHDEKVNSSNEDNNVDTAAYEAAAWNVGKISPNISCLDTEFSSVLEMKITTTKRALAYPLYRNWQLTIRCWDDVYLILINGRRAVLKALLEIREWFSWHDSYYIYNKIILDDYASWIQRQATDVVLKSLAEEIKGQKIKKVDVDLDLDELEEAAKEILQQKDST